MMAAAALRVPSSAGMLHAGIVAVAGTSVLDLGLAHLAGARWPAAGSTTRCRWPSRALPARESPFTTAVTFPERSRRSVLFVVRYSQRARAAASAGGRKSR